MRQVRDIVGPRSRRRHLSFVAVTGIAALALSACGGGSGFEDEGGGSDSGGDAPISVLIGSSGDPETKAVEEAVAAWAEEEGVEAKVQVAADLNQQLAQGFSGGKPPDVFYLSTDSFASYAATGPSSRTPPTWPTPTRSSRRCARRSPTRTSSGAHPRTSPRSRSSSTTSCGSRRGSPRTTSPRPGTSCGPSPRS